MAAKKSNKNTNTNTNATNANEQKNVDANEQTESHVLVAEMGDYRVMQIQAKKKGGYYVINEKTGEDTRSVGNVKTTRKHRSGGSEGNGKAYSFAVAGWAAVGFNSMLFVEGYAITCQVTRKIEQEHGTWQKALKAAGIRYTNHLASNNGNPETDAVAREKLDGILANLAGMKPTVKDPVKDEEDGETTTV